MNEYNIYILAVDKRQLARQYGILNFVIMERKITVVRWKFQLLINYLP